ncbi:TetR/AcrR family transcriptional regulator [Microbacterium sp. CFBP9034]|uniref:TetR/AcrR family transcriptional regulator n=1 Tax=Microbacterium sp. CFBP9034 TaxID=3096540 RepID=UPI002A6A5DE3|nr:TetR family transcriptional regulator C-terminal domain-containing protein [Microbacterium sp. CFBP9034]MDY0908668.1 TetR family transcriptional regulator C-terminal domain-containing protein [Microbacterium sp. CFBP9034]
MSTTDPRVRTRKAPAERAAEILDAATAIAREQGLGALTLRAVADRAGVASGLIAHYQPSMDDLVARVYSDLVEEEIREVRALAAREASPAARFARVLETLLDGSREDLTVVWVESWAISRRNPALAAAVRRQMSVWQLLLVEIADEGVADGSFATAETSAVAWQIMGMVDGLNAQSLVREADPATAIAQMSRAAETLLGARPGSLALAR